MGVLVITHWCVGYLAQQLSEPSPETHSFDERTQCDKTYLSMPINHSNVHHAVKVLVNVWTPHQRASLIMETITHSLGFSSYVTNFNCLTLSKLVIYLETAQIIPQQITPPSSVGSQLISTSKLT